VSDDIRSSYQRGQQHRAEAEAYARAHPPSPPPSADDRATSLAKAVAYRVGSSPNGTATLRQQGEEFIPDVEYEGALAKLRAAGFRVKEKTAWGVHGRRYRSAEIKG
jgi:hypothetical protein